MKLQDTFVPDVGSYEPIPTDWLQRRLDELQRVVSDANETF